MNRQRIPPEPGQESVWDYPRPPRLEETQKHIEVIFNTIVIASTRRAMRVLETSHPPVYYIPRQDVLMQYLLPSTGQSVCEWKGIAAYYSVVVEDKTVARAAWYYPDPTPNFRPIKDCIAFYPSLMDGCFVDGELVRPQPGDFYGGWITSDIVGPFKGEPGTYGW